MPERVTKKHQRFIIAVDFDGTLVKHEYPLIGEAVPDAIRVMKKLNERGHKIILFTMRSGEPLKQAVLWCFNQGIAIDWVNDNPTQYAWTKSRKVYANVYIDDAALGCPLVYPPDKDERPYADWEMIEKRLQNLNAI